MKKYEVMYILKANLEDAKRQEVMDGLHAIITSNNGTIENVDKWGTRKLAYPINYKSEGYYVLVNFQAEATVPAELERIMRITDAVVRYMIIVK